MMLNMAPQMRQRSGEIDLLALHRHNPARYPHLLESVLHGTAQSRYDILFAFPGETLRLRAEGVLLRGQRRIEGGFLAALDQWQRDEAAPAASELPFSGGWFLYLGYELAAEIEPRLQLPRATGAWPVALATRFPAAVIRDHQTRCTWLVAERAELCDALARDLDAMLSHESAAGDETLAIAALHEDAPGRFLSGVARVHDYILAGDVFQVNLSRAWRARLATVATPVTHADLYARLRKSNPAPFAALASFGARAILSTSPERLVSVRDGLIETRPIAGTRPRAVGMAQDRALSVELITHPKERAEHVMLIDLERNDLGRVCVPGSVEVNELMALESYASVHHIVSNVRGRLRVGVTPGQVIRAVFPGGTITGCPKLRCMEIIAELEGRGRGAYTGALGYLNRDGSLDLNILIRTLARDGDRLTLRTGAGIVADSIAGKELDETRAKAHAVLRALGQVI
jgi:anthranilate synthase component 1